MQSSTTSKEKIKTIAIGGFDGIHLGHQALIKRVNKNGAIVVIEKEVSNLTPGFDRLNFLNCELFIFKIEEIKELTPKEFITLLKNNFPNLKKIVVGYDFKFGKNRSCDIECLSSLFPNIDIVDEVKIDNIGIHSKIIREYLINGKIREANRFLGRYYQIFGEKIEGQGIGREKLFATINLSVERYLIPSEGVYATLTEINKKIFTSITFIGKRVSTDNNFSIETHLLDIKEIEIKKRENIKILFLDFIRKNRKFKNLKELKEQIKRDIEGRKRISH